MIPHGSGPSSYRLPEMTQDTPRITFEGSRRSGRHLRIIPARAGFTNSGSSRPVWQSDHPRSRGVYAPIEGASVGRQGSSPLARGLLVGALGEGEPGLDHPRSRGVYGARAHGGHALVGSSPLARGLRPQPGEEVAEDGIIPARAGFTAHAGHQPGPAADHPRSRGVYCSRSSSGIRPAGSSPLARGLPVVEKLADWFTGSSPLARGLRPQPGEEVAEDGIIPARAGFTSSGPGPTSGRPDHPRSRGVYQCNASISGSPGGSSPLARGLRHTYLIFWPGERIIPARAGFTPRLRGGSRAHADHPRSRGVYLE